MLGLAIRAFYRLQSYCIEFYFRAFTKVQMGSKVRFWGKPIIYLFDGMDIKIGNNVTINSSNWGYHVNMHSPVKLYVNQPGASITIGDHTRIHGSCLHAYSSITVGSKCLIAANCQIFDGNGHDLSMGNVEGRLKTIGPAEPIVIEDCVWIGANSIVLPGVTIGRGSVIGAGSVVAKSIPPMSIAAGNPARVIRTADGSEQVQPQR